MKTKAITGVMSAMMLGLFGCAGSAGDSSGTSESELTAKLQPTESISCSADSGGAKLGLVTTIDGKAAMLALRPVGSLYSLARDYTGKLSKSGKSWSWTATNASVTLDASLKGTWNDGKKTTKVTCAITGDAAAWRAAAGVADYEESVNGLASTIVEEMNGWADQDDTDDVEKVAEPNPYKVFVIETSRRASTDLGKIVADSGGAIPFREYSKENNVDDEEALSVAEDEYGPVGSCYNLGGGDDYGEWFSEASYETSLARIVEPTLRPGERGGFISRTDVKALSGLVEGTSPLAIEFTVGALTFLLPQDFSK